MIRTEELHLNIGPQHPSTHGVLRVVVKLDGEKIVEANPDIGYVHRNFEKICESRTYSQIIPYTDRLDYPGSMLNNLAYCMTIEKLAGITVPRRAEYIRVIAAELNRIASHLLSFGASGMDAGAFTIFLYCFREREQIVDLFEMLCGARLTYNYLRFGGVSQDLPEGFIEKVNAFCEYFKPKIDEYENFILNNYIYSQRTKNVGILGKDDALSYGASGPVLRACGMKHDLRKDEPYSAYNELDFDIPVGKNGDCWDRTKVRLDEMRQSIKIIEQALENIPDGEYLNSQVPRLLKPPAGEIYQHIESPRGELGFYIVSDGSSRPYRVKVRSPAFSNLSVIPLISPGLLIADLVVIIGSLDPCFGEIDR